TPEEILKTYGADILRLWACSVDYSEDVRISKEILERSADAYRKIRNTLRFLLGALADFDPAHAVKAESLQPLDAWALGALARLSSDVRGAFDRFEFHAASQALHGFCQMELSTRYFEIIKDRLYCDAQDSARRRSAQTACWHLAQGLATLLAPILSFTADEVWEHIPGMSGSVLEQRFPDGHARAEPEAWRALWTVRDAVQAAMEPHRAAKTLGTSLDAQLRLGLPETNQHELRGLGEPLEELLVVSGLEWSDTPELDIEIRAHAGTKCPRCWNHRGGHGKGEDVDLCLRCSDVVAG
ncbi:MAG TPA: class I tRNA ligase family protein, partial [Holophagaceae bacterium]|nr:class I tRNA ligase family protein [Holophagaceae bacterium]